jgi:hypothetical protein
METWKYWQGSSGALIKTGPGVVHTVTLKGGSDAGTLILRDEVSGSGDAILSIGASAGETVCVVLDVAFGVGLYAVLGGTAPQVTVTYR